MSEVRGVSENVGAIKERLADKDVLNLKALSVEYKQRYKDTGEVEHEYALMGFLSDWFAETIIHEFGSSKQSDLDLGLKISDELPKIVMLMPEFADDESRKKIFFREKLLGEVYDALIKPSLDENLLKQWQGLMAEVVAYRLLESDGWVRLANREVDKAGGDMIGIKKIQGDLCAFVFQVKSDRELRVSQLGYEMEETDVNRQKIRPRRMIDGSVWVVKQYLESQGYCDVDYRKSKSLFFMRDSRGDEVSCSLDAAYLGIPMQKAGYAGGVGQWYFQLRNGHIIGQKSWGDVIDDFTYQLENS